MEQYKIVIDNVKINVKVSSEEYKLVLPEIKEPTKIILESIKKELIAETKLSLAELTDPRETAKLRKKVAQRLDVLIKQKIPHISDEEEKFFAITLLNEILGLGDLEFVMTDPALEEIIVHKVKYPVMVYHKKYGWLKTNLTVDSDEKIQNYASILARMVGKQITTLTPLLDANMLTGDRANAVLYPIAYSGNTITIRKFAREPWTVVDFIKNKTLNSEIAALIWLAVQYEMSILISGGTASGKTSLLNVIMAFMPTNQRLISIEDTRELQLPETLFYAPLVTRVAGAEGEGEISMQRLLVNSLRMRPDRVILGEIRKGEDAQVLFEAMHTGHSVYATVHADTAHETIKRLINPPINVPANLLTAVNLNIVMFRDRRLNVRRVYQISEFLAAEKGTTPIKTNIVYRWVPKMDKIVSHLAPVRLFEDLSRHTNLTLDAIKKDLAEKKKILDWLVVNNIRDIASISRIFKDYYKDPNLVLAKIK